MRRRRLCEVHSVGLGAGGAVAIPEGRTRKCTGFRGSTGDGENVRTRRQSSEWGQIIEKALFQRLAFIRNDSS